MDINQILFIALIAAIVLAFLNLYSFWRKRQKSDAKKQLKNLYYPLHSIIAKKNKYVMTLNKESKEAFEKFAIEYYQIFLELRNQYLEHRICETPKLARTFNVLLHRHGMEGHGDHKQPYLPEEVIKNLALFELNYQVDEDGLSQLERNLQAVEEVIESDVSKMTKRL